MNWPLDLSLPQGRLTLPAAGRYTLQLARSDAAVDNLLGSARAALGAGGVGWMPEDGGLLGNLPAWENVLLSTQWHAPAALPVLEARIAGWMPRLGYDERAARTLLAQQPSRLSEDERRLIGWLRTLLARTRLVVLVGQALPVGAAGQRILALLDDELAGSALLVVGGEAPSGFVPLSFAAHEAGVP